MAILGIYFMQLILLIIIFIDIKSLDIYESVFVQIDSFNYGDISQNGKYAALTQLSLSAPQSLRVYTLNFQPNKTSLLINIPFANETGNLLKSVKLDRLGQTMAVADAGNTKFFTFQMINGNFSTTPSQSINLPNNPTYLDLSQDGNRICISGQNLQAQVYQSTTSPKNFQLLQTMNLTNQTGNSFLTIFDATGSCEFSQNNAVLIIQAADKYIFDYRFNSISNKYEYNVEVVTNLASGQTIKVTKLVQNLFIIGTSARLMIYRLNNLSNQFQKIQQINSCNVVSIDSTVNQDFINFQCSGANKTNTYFKNITTNVFQTNMTTKNKGNTQRISISSKGNFMMLLPDYFIGNFTLLYAYPCFPGYYQESSTSICKLCSSLFTTDCLLCDQTKCTCRISQGYSANRRVCTCTNNALCGNNTSNNNNTNNNQSNNNKNTTQNNNGVQVTALNQDTSYLIGPVAGGVAGSLVVIGLIILACCCLKAKIGLCMACMKNNDQNKQKTKQKQNNMKALHSIVFKMSKDGFKSTNNTNPSNSSASGLKFRQIIFGKRISKENQSKDYFKSTNNSNNGKFKFIDIKSSTLSNGFNDLKRDIQYPQASGERLQNQIQQQIQTQK